MECDNSSRRHLRFFIPDRNAEILENCVHEIEHLTDPSKNVVAIQRPHQIMESPIRCVNKALPPVVIVHLQPVSIVLPTQSSDERAVSLHVRKDVYAEASGIVLVLDIEKFPVTILLLIERGLDISDSMYCEDTAVRLD